MDREKELDAREKALREREKQLAEREKKLGPFSQAVQNRKEQWYDRVPLSAGQLTVVIRIIYALLGITAVLIILVAAGILKL